MSYVVSIYDVSSHDDTIDICFIPIISDIDLVLFNSWIVLLFQQKQNVVQSLPSHMLPSKYGFHIIGPLLDDRLKENLKKILKP